MVGNNRVCNVCGKQDITCDVACSSLGAVSFNYCLICSSMGAEPCGMSEQYISYDSNSDSYYDESDNHLPIYSKSGNRYNTRSEFRKYLEVSWNI